MLKTWCYMLVGKSWLPHTRGTFSMSDAFSKYMWAECGTFMLIYIVNIASVVCKASSPMLSASKRSTHMHIQENICTYIARCQFWYVYIHICLKYWFTRCPPESAIGNNKSNNNNVTTMSDHSYHVD